MNGFTINRPLQEGDNLQTRERMLMDLNTTPTYRLFATRDGRLQERATRLEATTEEAAKAEAAAIVERREDDGSWPEGCDAILMGPAPEVRCWMYADEWDEITDQFEEPTNG